MPPIICKRNTVDAISSKVSNDTVIPLSVLDDAESFLTKCKPFDIISGKNPFDEDGVEATHVDTNLVGKQLAATAAELASRSRKRSRSPQRSTVSAVTRLKGGGSSTAGVKSGHVSSPSSTGGGGVALSASHDDEFVSVVSPSPLASKLSATPGKRPGWAVRRMHAETPYQLLRARDLETRIRYGLDDEDFEWCSANEVEPVALQRGFTYLEWAYVAYLMDSTQSGGGGGGGTFLSSCAENGSGSSSAYNSGHRVKRPRRATSSAKTSTTIASVDSDGHHNNNGASSDGGPCAVCCRSVELCTVPLDEPIDPTDGVHGALGLRCQGCGVCAHLQCWLIGSVPRLPRAWMCDSCSILTQYKRRATLRCTICARSEGVLLPYRSSLYGGSGGGVLNGVSAGGIGNSSGAAGAIVNGAASASGDAVCHFVCALAMPELSIRLSPTVLRRNGLVDMHSRPFVAPSRRVHKSKCAQRCVHCEHEAGTCVQCHHPKCFEAMHAACAAEARTIECVPVEELAPASPVSARRDNKADGMVAADTSKYLPPAPDLVGESQADDASQFWGGCYAYCRRHFGFTLSNSLGSSTLAQQAEQTALDLDLTGLLTHEPTDPPQRRQKSQERCAYEWDEDGVYGDGTLCNTAPVVQRRGRGRPPVALVQRREAEKVLIVLLKNYWLERRQRRRKESAQWAAEINTHARDMLTAALRPELIKISTSKVRLSHFISLVPEWQQMLVIAVEGELPLPDEEYADVQRYRKASAHTRRSGNTMDLYSKLFGVRDNLHTFREISELLKVQTKQRTLQVQNALRQMELSCAWN